MKHYLLLLSTFALLTLCNSLYAQTASDYFLPPTIGNYLILHTLDNTQYQPWAPRTTKYYYDESVFFFGHDYFRHIAEEVLDNTPQDTGGFQVVWLRKDSVGNILMGAIITQGNSRDLDSALKFYPAFPWFPNEYLHAGYSRFMGTNLMKDSIISVTESVSVPAGSFSNCIEVCSMNLDSVGNITKREYAWYARGIGIVQEIRDIPGIETHITQLQSFRAVTSVRDNSSSLTPKAFSLEQNYPNPFNPSTTINYSLPKAGNVKLNIYNILGSKVATIVNEYKTAGIYSVQFNGSNLSSGIYLYRLESGNYSYVKKFMLIK